MEKKAVKIGDKWLGFGHPILIQTMADIKTSKTNEVIKQALELEKAGADMIRFAVLDNEDALSFKVLKEAISVPLIADIHFDYKLAILAIESGADKIRINPGNIPATHLEEIVKAAKKHHVAIRVGVNSGSYEIDHDPKTFFKSLDSYINQIESYGFSDIVISIKSSDPKTTYELNRYAYNRYPYPLHLGVTEAGLKDEALIKSTVAMAPLLSLGIGDTIRISLTDSPLEEVKACKTLLKSLGLKKNVPTLIACPTCGRTTVDLKSMATKVQKMLDSVNKDIVVAVMGCPVNGPGEAKNADYGIAGVDGKFLVFAKGQVIASMSEDEAYEFLKDKIAKF